MKYLKKSVIILSLFLLLSQIIFIAINLHIINYSRRHVSDDIAKTPRAPICIVPGAAVYGRNRISAVLEDRLETALALYRQGKATRFLLSGDHRTFYYDEVSRMRDFMLRKGVPMSALLLDHGGYNTYATMARARDVFAVDDCVVVTQRFHLDRAVYIARMMGLRATGYPADRRTYRYRVRYAAREYLARVKAFVDCMMDGRPETGSP